MLPEAPMLSRAGKGRWTRHHLTGQAGSYLPGKALRGFEDGHTPFKAVLSPRHVPLCFRHPAIPSSHPHQRPQLNSFLQLCARPRGEEEDGWS